jgi:hypothetical protein
MLEGTFVADFDPADSCVERNDWVAQEALRRTGGTLGQPCVSSCSHVSGNRRLSISRRRGS